MFLPCSIPEQKQNFWLIFSKKQKTSKLHDFIAKMMLKLPEIKEIQIMKSFFNQKY
jgi:hypothetical protein